jgi:N-methylhydantoinase B
MQIRRGDVIRHVQSGGGGYGDPAARAVNAVRDDLADGKISPEFARRHYPHAM